MRAFDALCHACERTHIVWVMWDHEKHDIIKIAHVDTLGGCGEYADHTLLASLDGLSSKDKWGPPA